MIMQALNVNIIRELFSELPPSLLPFKEFLLKDEIKINWTFSPEKKKTFHDLKKVVVCVTKLDFINFISKLEMPLTAFWNWFLMDI